VTHRDDERLKERFQGLRAETRGSGAVPDFGALMSEARREAGERPEFEVVEGGAPSGRRSLRHRRALRAGAWASAAIAAAVTGLILVDRGPSGDEDFEQLVAAYTSQTGSSGWNSPTSGLLEVPGIDLMRSVPSIGEPLRGLDPSASRAPQPPSEENNG